MKIIRKLSLRFKTIMIAMTTSALALAISGVFFSLYDYQLARAKAEQEYKVIATILADRSTAALEFFDEELATDNLSALSARTSIVLGCLYDSNDQLFANFVRPSYQQHNCPNQLNSDQIYPPPYDQPLPWPDPIRGPPATVRSGRRSRPGDERPKRKRWAGRSLRPGQRRSTRCIRRKA